MEPKVYGLILESPETMFLSIQYAYSLEEAIVLAKIEYEKQNPTKLGLLSTFMGAKLGLFTIKSIKELTAEKKMEDVIKSVNVVPAPLTATEAVHSNEKTGAEKIKLLLTEKQKNELMKEIIDKKDRDLFKKNLNVFSGSEIKYLKNQLK